MAIYKAKTKQISKIKGNMDLSAAFDIVIFHNDLNFKTEINEMINKSYEYESDTFITKILIGSISILREDIKLSQNFINKIKKTAEENLNTDLEKAKDLDNLISSYGYYIPLKISFGGLIVRGGQDIKKYKSEEFLTKLKEIFESDNNKNININISYGKEIEKIFDEYYSVSKKDVIVVI